MYPPPPPPRSGQRNTNSGNGTTTFRPPPPPPPRPSQAAAPMKRQNYGAPPPAPQAPQQVYEPYGKVQIPASSYSGMSQRNHQNSQSSYVLPSTPTEKRRATGSSSTYAHNAATLSFLVPTLASVLWWHESILVLQIFLFIGLGLYALDLMNSRDGVAVGVWIAALDMTIASGCGTLLQVDDSEATSSSTINFLLQFTVEGMSFCSWVSGIRNIIAHGLTCRIGRGCCFLCCKPAKCSFSNHS